MFEPSFDRPEPTQYFVDLAGSFHFPLPGSAPFPSVETAMQTERLIYTSLP